MAAFGCSRIVLCPVNDPDDNRTTEAQHRDLVNALKRYAPILEERGMIGLVEPLGFEICSLRFKKQAVDAIAEIGRPDLFKLVHDTFHHYLSGEKELYPESTGLIHTSGVVRAADIGDLTDDDRVLVDGSDVMGNRDQITGLFAGGYEGYLSYEPFSPSIQVLTPEKLSTEIRGSLEFLGL